VREGCHGLGPIPAAVAQENDAARPHAGAGCRLDDALGAGSAPVPGIDRPQHLTKTLSAQDALHDPVGCAIRWPHASTSRSMGKLPLNLPRRQRGQIAVRDGDVLLRPAAVGCPASPEVRAADAAGLGADRRPPNMAAGVVEDYGMLVAAVITVGWIIWGIAPRGRPGTP
jgi:hypothetical protein